MNRSTKKYDGHGWFVPNGPVVMIRVGCCCCCVRLDAKQVAGCDRPACVNPKLYSSEVFYELYWCASFDNLFSTVKICVFCIRTCALMRLLKSTHTRTLSFSSQYEERGRIAERACIDSGVSVDVDIDCGNVIVHADDDDDKQAGAVSRYTNTVIADLFCVFCVSRPAKRSFVIDRRQDDGDAGECDSTAAAPRTLPQVVLQRIRGNARHAILFGRNRWLTMQSIEIVIFIDVRVMAQERRGRDELGNIRCPLDDCPGLLMRSVRSFVVRRRRRSSV